MLTIATQFFSDTYTRFVRSRSEVVDIGDEFIWSVARKMTRTPEEAAAAVRLMQDDIDKCTAERSIPSQNFESRIPAAIARRRVLKFLGMI